MEPFRVPAPGESAKPAYTPVELERMAATNRRSEKIAQRKDAAKRRWLLLNAFIDAGMAGLELSDVAVWVTLYRHARADGISTVARLRLAEITGLAPNTITSSLARLASAGWIARLRRGGPSGGIAVHKLKTPGEVVQ